VPATSATPTLPRRKRAATVANLDKFTALRVIDTQQLSPHMKRVRFAGTNLHSFATSEHLHIGLLIPPADAARQDWLIMRADGKARLRDPACPPINRKYTIRSIDAPAGQIAIDFVLHADGGPGGQWADTAQIGDVVGMLGPGGRGLVAADWYLLAGDETALPAIGRMLESMPDDAVGQVIVEIADEAEQQALRVPPGMAVQWLHRHGAPAGTTTQLLQAVQALSLPQGNVRPFAWVGAEFTAAQAIRHYLCREAGIAKSDQLVVAYWRLGKADGAGEIS